MQLKSKQTNNRVKQRAQNLKSRFSREDVQMASGSMERCSTSLVIYTTTGCHLTPLRRAIMKGQEMTGVVRVRSAGSHCDNSVEAPYKIKIII